MTSVLIKWETENGDEDTEGRMSGDNRGRDWGDVAARQGTDGDHQKLEAARENQFFPKALRGSAALPAPSFPASSLQNCERTPLCCLGPCCGSPRA